MASNPEISLDKMNEVDSVHNEPPPFQGSKEDKQASRQRQAMFLRHVLLIADRFSRKGITYPMLCTAVNWLEREQFDDIAIERNANGLCGYVLCDKPHVCTLKQQYRIRSSQHRVYDVTKSKPFCSDWCYSAARHVRKQISTEPGWCRLQPTCQITLLSRDARTKPGHLVLDGLRRLRLSDSDPSDQSSEESDPDKDSSGTVSDPSDDESLYLDQRHWDDEDIKRFGSKRSSKIRAEKPSKPETTWGVQVRPPTSNLIVERKKQPEGTTHPCQENDSCLSETAETNRTLIETGTLDLFEGIANRLIQWISQKSYRILTNNDPECESQLMEIKCSAFSQSASEDPAHSELLSPGVIPLVDNVSASTIRRQLFLEQLMPRVKAILNQFGIPYLSVLTRLQNTIDHFRLTKQNTHLNPTQRNLAALSLLILMYPPNQPCILNDAQLSTLVEQFATRSKEEFFDTVIKPVRKHFSESRI